MAYNIRCLDHTEVGDAASQFRERRNEIQEQGAAFIYSPRYGDWIIVCRDEWVKAALHRRYGGGTAVYTVHEAQQLAACDAVMADAIHRTVRDMQAYVGHLVSKEAT